MTLTELNDDTHHILQTQSYTELFNIYDWTIINTEISEYHKPKKHSLFLTLLCKSEQDSPDSFSGKNCYSVVV